MKTSAKIIIYTQSDEKDLDIVAPLWRKLILHHKERTREMFKEYFEKITFDERRLQLINKSSKGVLHIDLAKDSNTGKLIGYCISTVDENKHGEFESIYIEPEYRRNGIGDYFMKKALE